MYYIGICDDEIKTCNELEKYIEAYLKSNYLIASIEVFYSGETLCKYLNAENPRFNLVFLDIELPQINGIQVGNYIRDLLKDEVVEIIYISSKTNYAMELFANRPLDFIVKPLQYDKIAKTLDVANKRGRIRKKLFEYQCNQIVKRVPLHEIMYFKSDNKKINMILYDGTTAIFTSKLKDIQKKISNVIFLQIHKSYLINCDFVLEYTYEWVKMSNGDILNISKVNRNQVRDKLMKQEF